MWGCGNKRGGAYVEQPSIDIIFNITATPKGVAIKSSTITFRGEEARFAHLIPPLCYRNPQGGSNNCNPPLGGGGSRAKRGGGAGGARSAKRGGGSSPNLRLPFADPPPSFRRTSAFLSPKSTWLFGEQPIDNQRIKTYWYTYDPYYNANIPRKSVKKHQQPPFLSQFVHT